MDRKNFEILYNPASLSTLMVSDICVKATLSNHERKLLSNLENIARQTSCCGRLSSGHELQTELEKLNLSIENLNLFLQKINQAMSQIRSFYSIESDNQKLYFIFFKIVLNLKSKIQSLSNQSAIPTQLWVALEHSFVLLDEWEQHLMATTPFVHDTESYDYQ